MHLSHLPTWSCENILTMKIIMDFFFFFFGYKSGIFNQIKTQVHEHDMIDDTKENQVQTYKGN